MNPLGTALEKGTGLPSGGVVAGQRFFDGSRQKKQLDERQEARADNEALLR